MGSGRPFRPEIHQLRPHPGQIQSAERIGSLLAGSAIMASHTDDFEHAVQDAYSVRCAPQVHGAVTDTLDHMEAVLSREMGSVVDNPIVFPDSGQMLSAGNFHGQPLAFVLDFATIAVSELASISERRTNRILDPVRSRGLPAFLAANPGVNSGYMISQYLQAALVAENRILSHRASVDSISTSGGQEDHVSMGWGAGKKLLEVINNVRRVLAVEIICAVQGIEYRSPLRPASGTGEFVSLVRDHVPPSCRGPINIRRDRTCGEPDRRWGVRKSLMSDLFLSGIGHLTTNIGGAVTDAVVVVEDGHITFAGPAGDAPEQGDLPRHECHGAAVIPGFVDAHTHPHLLR